MAEGDRDSLKRRLDRVLTADSEFLEGPDAQQWKVEIEEDLPPSFAQVLPPGALVFANDGFGDNLLLVPDREAVLVFWHEGATVEEYSPTLAELLPTHRRPPSDHPPVRYREGDEPVALGDRVRIRYWLFFNDPGTVDYAPGISEKKPAMERDGLAWVGIKLDNGGRVDTIVMPDGALKKTVRLLARGGDRDSDGVRADTRRRPAGAVPGPPRAR